MKNILLIAILFLYFIFAGTAVRAQWQQSNGPFAGDISFFKVKDDTIYTGTFGSELFRSTDDLASWKQLNMGGGYGMVSLGNTLILAGGGINISNDAGISWLSTYSPLCGFNPFFFSAITVCGHNVIAGAYGFGTCPNGIFLSTDTGASWSNILSGFGAASLAVNGNLVFAGTTDGIYLSTDSGLTWALQSNNGLPLGLDIRAMTIKSDTLFACVYDNLIGGVFFSADSGANWSALNNGLTCLNTQSILTIGSDIFCGTLDSGLFVTSNNGISWNHIDPSSGLTSKDIGSLGVNGSAIYCGTVDGIFTSTDGGTTWIHSGIPITSVWALARNGNDIIASATGRGTYIYRNGGPDWTRSISGLPVLSYSSPFYSLTTNASKIFASTENGVYESINNGNTWILDSAGIGNDKVISSLEAYNQTIFAGTSAGLYSSADNGSNWSAVTVGLPQPFLPTAIKTNDGKYVVAGGNTNNGGQIFFSADSGVTWSLSNFSSSGGTARAFAFKGTDIYVASDGSGIYKSINNGATWTLTSCPLFNPAYSLAVSENNIFAGTGGAVYLSQDDGANWSEIDSGFSTPLSTSILRWVLSLTTDANYLYAGTSSYGVWKRPLSDFAPVGIKENSFITNSGYNIYPNPSNGIFRLDLEKSFKNAEVEIFNLLGDKVYSRICDDKKIKIDISQVPPGIYITRIYCNDVVYYKKILKQ